MGFVGRSLRKATLLHDRGTLGVVWNAPALTVRFGSGAVKALKLASSAYWWAVLAAALAGAALLPARVGLIHAPGPSRHRAMDLLNGGPRGHNYHGPVPLRQHPDDCGPGVLLPRSSYGCPRPTGLDQFRTTSRSAASGRSASGRSVETM